LDDPVAALVDAFPRATEEAWRALVRKALGGADADSLASRTADGLVVAPFYTATSEAAPSRSPFPPGHEGRPWDIRAIVDLGQPAAANAAVLEALEGGASSVLIEIDQGAGSGVAARSEQDMGRLLAGVLTDVAPVALDAGYLGVQCAEWLATVAKASPAAPLALHLDPLSSFARAGVSPGPISAHLAAGAAVAARLAEPYPRASLFLASGRAVHEAGGSEAWEVAFAVASGLAYAKALVGAGGALPASFSRIVLGLTADADVFLTIAKLRAARLVWGRIARACGAAPFATVEVRSSRRMLTRSDAWTNLVRLTLAGFAAAAGGADALALDPFTDAAGPATALARRQSRNAQLILMEEAGVGRVEDPVAGSWYARSLTEGLARAAWTRFTAIEAAGGVVAALEGGLIAEAVEAAREALETALACGGIRIIGVTDFRGEDAAGATEGPGQRSPAPPDVGLAGRDSRCPALAAIRLEDLV
jgi:methylmalonyl-CoA mutase